MALRLRVFLNAEEDRTLQELRYASTVPQRVKDRAEAVRLSAQGWYVERIAAYLGWNVATVRVALKRWIEQGLGGLWDRKQPKKPTRWSDDDIDCVEKWLKEDERTYNSKQLARRLKEERNVEITPSHLRCVLKLRGIRWKRTRSSHKRKQDPKLKEVKQADLEMLQWAAAAGDIDLFFGDESGCHPWSETSYSYYFMGEQKRQEQTQRQGRRLNILGFFQPLLSFFYGLVLGSVNSQRFIEVMDEQAYQAQEVLKQTGRIRVIVLDNASIHKSKVTRACWPRWEKLGLYIFFLPPYSSEMNPIELEWEHLKRDELAGRMFEDELALTDAIIDGLNARAEQNGHFSERFHFQSA